jgi:hypothetical protein
MIQQVFHSMMICQIAVICISLSLVNAQSINSEKSDRMELFPVSGLPKSSQNFRPLPLQHEISKKMGTYAFIFTHFGRRKTTTASKKVFAASPIPTSATTPALKTTTDKPVGNNCTTMVPLSESELGNRDVNSQTERSIA